MEYASSYKELRPSDPREALNHIAAMKASIERYLALNKPLKNEHLNYICNYANDIFDEKYNSIFTDADPVQSFNVLSNLQWTLTQTILDEEKMVEMQRAALQFEGEKFSKFVRFLGTKSPELVKKRDNYFRKIAPHLDESPIRLDFNPNGALPVAVVEEARKFRESFEANPLDYSDIMVELFNVPSDFDECIAFCTRQVLNSIQLHRKKIAIFENLNCKTIRALDSRFTNQITEMVGVGATISILHSLNEIKTSQNERIVKIIDLLTCLCDEMSDIRLTHPDFVGFSDKWVPFSREWMFMNFKLLGFEGSRNNVFFEGFVQNAEDKDFLRSLLPSSYLSTYRIITALRQFLPAYIDPHLPYLLASTDYDYPTEYSPPIMDCLFKKTDKCFNMVRYPKRGINIKSVQGFFNQTLHKAWDQCLVETRADVFRFPNEQVMEFLLEASNMKFAYDSEEILQPIVEMGAEKSLEHSSEEEHTEIAPAIQETKSEPLIETTTDNQKSSESDQKDDCDDQKYVIDNQKDGIHNQMDGNYNQKSDDQIKVATTSGANFRELLKPQTVDIEYDEVAAAEELEYYETKMAEYRKRPLETMKIPKYSKLTIEPIQNYGKKDVNVCFFSVEDFIAAIPAVNDLYWENVTKNSALFGLANRNLRYQWYFDERIIIDGDSYFFLCQVFNLVEGRKQLTFHNFINAFNNLVNVEDVSIPSGKVKNRTVFEFRHSFIVNGQVCVPPIGGVHPEHVSSRFNHKQIRKFLLHGGAHPYFFRVLHKK